MIYALSFRQSNSFSTMLLLRETLQAGQQREDSRYVGLDRELSQPFSGTLAVEVNTAIPTWL